MTNVATLKQPPILKLSFLTAMCERFGYYILSFMLVLFAKAEYGMTDTAAFGLFAVITALTFMTPAIGGYIADNYLGVRRSIILGLTVEGIGLCSLAIPNHFMFPFSCALIVIGVGLFKTSPTNLLGRSYESKDPRIDTGFTLYYMGINIGSFVSSLLSGVIERYFGWHVAFFVGGLGVLAGLLFYFIFRKTAANLDSPIGESKASLKVWLTMIGSIIVTGILFSFLLSYTTINNILFAVVGIVLLGYYIYEMIKSTQQERLKIIACLALIFIGIIYFILYFQLYTSVELFIHRMVNRNVLGMVIPTEAYLGLNPVWVVIFGPVLAFVYQVISKKYGKDLAVTTKFSIGLLVISLCFITLVAGTFFTNENFQISSWWIVLAICLYTLGEMLISALGVAMVMRLVPKRMYGITMGTWFYGSSLAGLSSGLFASLANVPDSITDLHLMMPIYTGAFTKLGVGGLIVTAIVFLFANKIKKMGDLE